MWYSERMELQQQLRDLMDEGWTIESIARVLGIDRESGSRWLHGQQPRVPTVASLALEHPAFRKAPGWGRKPPVSAEGRTVANMVGELMERGWTVTAIAEVLGVRRDNLSRWYHGLKPESPQMLVLALEHPSLQKRKPPKQRRYTSKRGVP